MGAHSLDQALSLRRSRRDFEDRAVPLDLVHRLLWAGQGITDGSGKRTAPSAHALHPLRLMVAAGNIGDLAPGLYTTGEDPSQLTPAAHGDLRADLQTAAIDDQPWIGRAAGIITVCADVVAPLQAFANQAPYGARGERYVYIEAGAAAQNIQLMGTAEGLGCVLVAGFSDEATARILGLEAPIAPILHICFGWPAPA